MALMDINPMGFQSEMLWGPMSLVEVLKVGAKYRAKPFTAWGAAGSRELLPACVLPPQGQGLWQLCV